MAYCWIDYDGIERLARVASGEAPRHLKRYKGKEVVPVAKARAAYDRLRNWRLVANEVRRLDGSKFTPDAIKHAVAWDDKGNPGFRNGPFDPRQRVDA